MKRALVLTLAVSGLCLGCVTKGDHNAVKKALSATRQDLMASKAHGHDLEKALAHERRHLAELEEILRSHESNLAGLRTELASVIKDRSALSASIAEMEQALRELRIRRQKADERVAQYRDLLTRFQQMIDAGTLRVRIVEGRIMLEMPTDILFPTGKASLSDEGATAITEVAKVLATIDDRQFQVEGHTDNVPIRTARYPSNWELAQARARVVVKTMTEGGMPSERISTAAFSKYRPTASNDTEEGKAHNRRIEIVMLPDLSALPGANELEALSKPGE